MSANSSPILVVGGGIAGMTAAIFAARANLKVIIIEESVYGGLANWTYVIKQGDILDYLDLKALTYSNLMVFIVHYPN